MCSVLVYVLYVQCMWNRYYIVSYIYIYIYAIYLVQYLSIMCVLCKELYVAELIIFQFPWNSQGIASLFTTGTFPGFGHVTSQMSHSQWSNRKEETCPNWELVLCTLNKKLHMFLNAMVQKKKKQPPSNLAQTIFVARDFEVSTSPWGSPWLQ